MKNVVLGLMFSTAAVAAVGGASAPGRTLGGMHKSLGAFSVYFGASAVFNKRDVKVMTDMRTEYRAGYAYADPGVQTFYGTWGAATPAVPAGREHIGDVVQLAGQPAAAVGNWQVGFGRAFAFTGESPAYWLIHDADGAGWVAGDVTADVTKWVMEKAMFSPGVAADIPDNKAWVLDDAYVAKAHDMTHLKYHTLGLRLEAGLGFRVVDTLKLSLMLSYQFERKDKKAKNFRENVCFQTKGEETVVINDDGFHGKGNLILSSFAFNNGNIASGMKISADVRTTLGVMFGVEWRPVEMLALSVRAGVKRYTLEVTYEGGDLAYPGTTSLYTDAFTKTNNRYKLLLSQKDVKRIMKTVRWPFAVGGDLRVIFCGLHSLHFGLEYTSFEADLDFEKQVTPSSKTSDDSSNTTPAPKGTMRLSDPYTAAPTANQFRDGLGTHQFAATDVVNVFTTKIQVSDLTVSAGYMLAC